MTTPEHRSPPSEAPSTNDLEASLALGLSAAIERVTAALKEEGFGVLTRIDVHETLRQKIGVEFRPYVILGACNPGLAHRALEAASEVGLLLPCNVTVEQSGDEAGSSRVRMLDPDVMMRAVDSGEPPAALAEVAREARERLVRVAAALRACP